MVRRPRYVVCVVTDGHDVSTVHTRRGVLGLLVSGLWFVATGCTGGGGGARPGLGRKYLRGTARVAGELVVDVVGNMVADQLAQLAAPPTEVPPDLEPCPSDWPVACTDYCCAPGLICCTVDGASHCCAPCGATGCPGGTTCCDDQYCCRDGDICCGDTGCGLPDAICCGTAICAPGGVCCKGGCGAPGAICCGSTICAPGEVCCSNGTCHSAGATCCNDGHACSAGDFCCFDKCCADGAGCDAIGCCPAGWGRCPAGQCAPADSHCCGTGYCYSNQYCCDGYCCDY